MAQNTVAKTIELTEGWLDQGSSTSHESTIVELEMALHDAANVYDFYFIYDSFGDYQVGVAVELESGQRSFFIAGRKRSSDPYEALNFDAEGNLVLPS